MFSYRCWNFFLITSSHLFNTALQVKIRFLFTFFFFLFSRPAIELLTLVKEKHENLDKSIYLFKFWERKFHLKIKAIFYLHFAFFLLLKSNWFHVKGNSGLEAQGRIEMNIKKTCFGYCSFRDHHFTKCNER